MIDTGLRTTTGVCVCLCVSVCGTACLRACVRVYDYVYLYVGVRVFMCDRYKMRATTDV